MRSEERAGIISILMLFLWGTLITEPFHIFARFIARAVHYACKGIGISGIAASLALYVVVVSVIILMQKLEPTKLGVFIPCAISVTFIAMLLVKIFMNRSVVISDSLCLAIPAAIALAFYIIKFEKGLKWFAYIYTYSLAVALVNSLLFVPIAKLGTVAAKMENQVNDTVKAERSADLIKCGNELKHKYMEKFVGENAEVLFEEEEIIDGTAFYTGHTREYIKVAARSERDLTNVLTDVKITEIYNDEILLAEI